MNTIIRRKKVLFVCEAVTLAHVARVLVLAKRLLDRYEVVIAADPSVHYWFKKENWQPLTIESLDGEIFLSRLRRGQCVFTKSELHNNVQQDVSVMGIIEPDIVVGDFRLSLSISCKMMSVPYIAVGNAYWHPDAGLPLPVPELPMTRLLGVRIGQWLFNMFADSLMSLHVSRYNQVRQGFGLKPFEGSLGEVYLESDATALADLPECYPMLSDCNKYKLLGLCIWNPPIELPEWWTAIDGNSRPTAFVSLGSSGQLNAIDAVVTALLKNGWNVMLATAGRASHNKYSGVKNLYVADFLPGFDAAQRSNVIVCNGGSPMCQLAIASGKPVLGIPSNLDQFLNMAMMTKEKLGIQLRPERINAKLVNSALSEIEYGDCLSHVQKIKIAADEYDCGLSLQALIDQLLKDKERPLSGPFFL